MDIIYPDSFLKGVEMNIFMKKLLLSGLVAGFSIMIVGLGLIPLIGNQMRDVLLNHNALPLGTFSIFFFTAVSFINGFYLMAIYALLKQKFSFEKKANLCISTAFWFLTYVLANLSLVAYGFMPLKLSLIGTIWGYFELLSAGMMGSILFNKKS